MVQSLHTATRRVALALVVIVLGILPCASKENRYNISGRITDTDGEPLELAVIILNKSIYAQADADGRYTLEHIAPGTYSYEVSFVGYEEQTGKITVTNAPVSLNFKLKALSLQLQGVTVTAKQQTMESRSTIGEEAIKHIQPKSLSDLLQLVPGNLTENPNLNAMSQAHIREIGTNSNNSLGTSVVVDGSPLSNDANLQHLSTSRYGSRSSANEDGMSDQTTSGSGVDLRTVSSGNIESVDIVRGIPSVEYGNLTSGLVIVKTKSGQTPWEAKFSADPFSKLAYVGKGFNLKGGGAMNFSADYSQSWADVLRHTRGYDRLTAAGGYSTYFGKVSFNVRGSFYANVNTRKEDPQSQQLDLHYTNKNIGGRLSVYGKYNSGGGFLTGLNYNLSASYSHTTDEHYNFIASPDGVITDVREDGIHEAYFNNKSYYASYSIEGKPLNLYGQVMANKYIQLSDDNYTDIKAGVEYKRDSNSGAGLEFDLMAPPQSSSAQTLRPRAYSDIPALSTASAFVSDKLSLVPFGHKFQIEGGVRVSNLFIDEAKSGRGDIFVVEPRVNASLGLLKESRNGVELNLTGGYGISNKMPTLLYLYPDNVYYDNVSFNRYTEDPNDRLALIATNVITDTQNPDLRPTNTEKWEIGLSARSGQRSAFVTFFHEQHNHEFGFDSQLFISEFPWYNALPAGSSNARFDSTTGQLSYTLDGKTITAKPDEIKKRMHTWSQPANNTSSTKYGIEYGLDFGEFKPLRTSLNVSGAWFHIKRVNETTSLKYVDLNYDYVGVMPAGSGSVRDRVNTTFRFITHIPEVEMIFTTSLQVVWFESARSVYEIDGKNAYHNIVYQDKNYLAVNPLGFYDKNYNYTAWEDRDMSKESELFRMVTRYQTYGFESDTISPWCMLNFRITKEIGKVAEISFTANNCTNSSRYHVNKWSLSKTQLFPNFYFGAEVKIKI